MTASDAWLLVIDDSLLIAIGEHEMVEFINTPISFTVPGAPQYCDSVLFWQQKMAPIMDIPTLLGRTEPESRTTMMGLVAYQEKPGVAVKQLALHLKEAPQKIRVEDEQACDLPEEISDSLLAPICLSCFEHNNRAVVIIDIARLCSAEFRDLVMAEKELGGIDHEPEVDLEADSGVDEEPDSISVDAI